jgi:hypothetical protein
MFEEGGTRKEEGELSWEGESKREGAGSSFSAEGRPS